MLPEGKYIAQPTEAALGYTNGGKEQVAVGFEIVEGPHAGHQMTWYGYFTHKTEERTLEALEACGWDGVDIADLSSVGRKRVQLVVEHERDEKSGDFNARIRWVNALGIAMKNRMNDQQRSDFAARINNRRQQGNAPQGNTNYNFSRDRH